MGAKEWDRVDHPQIVMIMELAAADSASLDLDAASRPSKCARAAAALSTVSVVTMVIVAAAPLNVAHCCWGVTSLLRRGALELIHWRLGERASWRREVGGCKHARRRVLETRNALYTLQHVQRRDIHHRLEHRRCRHLSHDRRYREKVCSYVARLN